MTSPWAYLSLEPAVPRSGRKKMRWQVREHSRNSYRPSVHPLLSKYELIDHRSSVGKTSETWTDQCFLAESISGNMCLKSRVGGGSWSGRSVRFLTWSVRRVVVLLWSVRLDPDSTSPLIDQFDFSSDRSVQFSSWSGQSVRFPTWSTRRRVVVMLWPFRSVSDLAGPFGSLSGRSNALYEPFSNISISNKSIEPVNGTYLFIYSCTYLFIWSYWFIDSFIPIFLHLFLHYIYIYTPRSR